MCGKFLSGLVGHCKAGEIDLDEHQSRKLLREPKKDDWVVDAKKPFGGPEQIVHDLGRYADRVAISSARMISIPQEWQRALFARHGDSLRKGFLVGARILDGAMVEVLARGGIDAGATIPISFKALVLETWCRAMAGLSGGCGDAVSSCVRIWNEHPTMAEPEFELNAEVAHREIEGQILLLTPNDDVLYTLNDSGRLAWEMLVAGASAGEITTRMAETYRLPAEDARRDVAAVFADLQHLGVVIRGS